MIYFISDTHFGHRNICKYRNIFTTPQEHDEFIISNWNKVILKERYQVWVLGDMCIKNNSYDMYKLISRLRGTIRVIPGNHCFMDYYKHPRIRIEPGLVSKYNFWLSHCPIHELELRGKKNIHGHVHNCTINNSKYFNCCVENINYTPIHIDEIRSIFSSK